MYVDGNFEWNFYAGQEKKQFSSWEHNLETKIPCRATEYFCAKSACA
jgi:hypothetical protein